MAINKVVYGNTTLVDLTEDTATEEDVMEGKTFHDASGQRRTGSATQGGRVQDVEVNGESVVNTQGIAEVVVPVSGDVSTTDSFESYTGGKVKSLQMECEPIQDLHGYSEPWVGGSRKNKLDKDNYVLSYTSDNLVIIGTVNIESGKSYTFSCEQDKDLTGSTRNTLAVTYDGNTYYEMVNSNYHNEKGTHTYNFTSNYTGTATLAFWCHTPSDTSITYSRFMFQEGVYTSYEPYENKCPISAHTQAKLEQRGKNLCDPTVIPLNGLGGDHYVATTLPVGSVVARIKGGKTYTVSIKNAQTIFTSTCASYPTVDAPMVDVYAGSGGLSVKSKTITTSVGANYLVVNTGSNNYEEIQIEEGSSATDYEPYQGKDYIINLGGSYYWIKGDVVSGKWYVVGKGVDLGTLNWAKGSVTYYAEVSGIKIQTNQSQKMNAYCSSYKISAQSEQEYNTISGLNWGANIAFWNLVDYSDANQVKTAMSGVQLVYELATPIPINLDPQLIEVFIGENNFSAPLEKQEIIEIVARNISEFNEVIDDENISDEFTYSSTKIEDRLDEYVDKDAVEEKSATTEFETINGGILSSLKVALTPNQDLHGYPNPWVGGANVNKFPSAVAESKTASGVTVVSDGHGTYALSGTSTADVSIDFDIEQAYTIPQSIGNGGQGCCYFFNNKTYSGGEFLFYFMDGTREVDSWSMSDLNRINSTYSAMAGQTCNKVRFKVVNGTNVDGLKISPMFSENGLTTNPFTWWKNICPISGHAQVKINNGKNLIGLGTRLDGYAGENYFVENATSVGYYFKTADLPDTVTVNDVGGNRAYITYFNNVPAPYENFISKDQSQQTVPKTFTVDKTAEYVHIQLSYGTTDVTNIQIEEGSTATAYVPYNGYQITVNLGGTYYSGILDVVSGVFTPDTAEVVYDGSNDEGWNSDRPNYRVFISVPDIKSDTTNIISSAFRRVLPSETYQGVSGIACSSTLLFVGTLGMSVADWRTFLSNNPLQVNYELATPLTIQLTPQQVKALVGENHLSALLEGQEIDEVKYKEAFDFNDVIKVANYFTLPLQTFTFTNKVCDVNDSRVTSNSLVDVYFTSDSMPSVEDAGITVESQNGKIVMTAEEQPVGTIQGRIKVVN